MILSRIKELEEINEEHRKLNGKLRQENKQLQKENKQLEEYNNHLIRSITSCEELLLNKINIIDKAIEYIEEKSKSNIRNIVIITLAEIEKLSKILKGEE